MTKSSYVLTRNNPLPHRQDRKSVVGHVAIITAYISEILRVREVGQVSVVELLTGQVVTVLPRLEITGFDAIGLKKLLVGHAERLTDSLSNDLSLNGWTERREKHRLHSC